MAFDSKATPKSSLEELSGRLDFTDMSNKLLHAVLENDKETVDDGKLIEESINAGIGAFTADLLYERFVKNYAMSKKLVGPTLVRLLTGFDPSYIQKNMRIPEFARKLKGIIESKVDHLKEKDLIDKHGQIEHAGLELTGIVAVLEELDKLDPKGHLGEHHKDEQSPEGEPTDVRQFSRGDRYQDLSLRKTLKLAARRGHRSIQKSDVRVSRRKAVGRLSILFALDASSSMKGEKLTRCKRAGIALSWNAIKNQDEVGLLVFGTDVKAVVNPTTDFRVLLQSIMGARATTQTNMTLTIRKAREMFTNTDRSKHVIVISDSKPTVGSEPAKDLLGEVSSARAAGITLSMVGIDLDDEGKKLAQQIVEMGSGRLYLVKKLESLSQLVIEEYMRFS